MARSNKQKFIFLNDFIDKAKESALPADRETACNIAILMFHMLENEWRSAQTFKEGSKKVWDIVKTNGVYDSLDPHWWKDPYVRKGNKSDQDYSDSLDVDLD